MIQIRITAASGVFSLFPDRRKKGSYLSTSCMSWLRFIAPAFGCDVVRSAGRCVVLAVLAGLAGGLWLRVLVWQVGYGEEF